MSQYDTIVVGAGRVGSDRSPAARRGGAAGAGARGPRPDRRTHLDRPQRRSSDRSRRLLDPRHRRQSAGRGGSRLRSADRGVHRGGVPAGQPSDRLLRPGRPAPERRRGAAVRRRRPRVRRGTRPHRRRLDPGQLVRRRGGGDPGRSRTGTPTGRSGCGSTSGTAPRSSTASGSTTWPPTAWTTMPSTATRSCSPTATTGSPTHLAVGLEVRLEHVVRQVRWSTEGVTLTTDQGDVTRRSRRGDRTDRGADVRRLRDRAGAAASRWPGPCSGSR